MLRTLAPLFAPQVVAFTLVFGAVQAAEAGAFGDVWSPSSGSAAVLWGDQTHATPETLSAWLAERGRTYETWAKRHPVAAVELERSAIVQARSRTAESLLPIDTSFLVLSILVLASIGLLGVPGAAAALAGRVPHLLRERRLRVVFWPAGMASAVLLGLLAARLVP